MTQQLLNYKHLLAFSYVVFNDREATHFNLAEHNLWLEAMHLTDKGLLKSERKYLDAIQTTRYSLADNIKEKTPRFPN